jgi:hypothetical protein
MTPFSEVVSDDSLPNVLAVAEAVLTDAVAPPRFATPCLRRAWLLTLGSIGPLPERIATYPRLSRRNRRRFAEAWRNLEAGEMPTRAEMLAQVRALRRLDRRPPRRTLFLAGLLGVLALSGLLALRMASGSVAMRSGVPLGPWRVQIFAIKEFRGPSVSFRANDARFKWKAAGHETMPKDKFATRLSTCLELDEEATIQFALIADDGARLFVDDAKVIEAWRKKNKLRRKTMKLAPGSHAIVVEHHDNRGVATVELTASIDGGQPEPLPRGMLRYSADGGC